MMLVWPKSNGKKKFSEGRNETLECTLKTLQNGACMIKNMMNVYIELVKNKDDCPVENGEYESS